MNWPSVSGSIIQDCGSGSERKYSRNYNWFDFIVSRLARQQLLSCLAHPTPESGGQNTGGLLKIYCKKISSNTVKMYFA
jgi:hypothetical protein